ncbi:hypothetical protein AAFF_G00363590 [Aldrovandia affinis]|uniref:Uncharacterized protein n=1 Tax=Aldrovandia affinis TaxID=143900 RepID=A0AAD7WMU1_9TELE|nr:hypothetical protein AAFF_G00363590 [Aldrovandia affinis]
MAPWTTGRCQGGLGAPAVPPSDYGGACGGGERMDGDPVAPGKGTHGRGPDRPGTRLQPGGATEGVCARGQSAGASPHSRVQIPGLMERGDGKGQ